MVTLSDTCGALAVPSAPTCPTLTPMHCAGPPNRPVAPYNSHLNRIIQGSSHETEPTIGVQQRSMYGLAFPESLLFMVPFQPMYMSRVLSSGTYRHNSLRYPHYDYGMPA